MEVAMEWGGPDVGGTNGDCGGGEGCVGWACDRDETGNMAGLLAKE